MDPSVITILHHVQLANLFNTANAALFGYDYLLTFSEEVRYLREMPFTPVTVLFLLTRYLPFVDIALVIVYQQAPYIPPNICKPLFEGSGMLQLCGVILSEVILMVRTWAVWNRNKWIGSLLAVCAVATWVPSLYTVQFFLSGLEFAPQGPGCQVAGALHAKSFLAYILVTAFESLLLGLTLFKSVTSYRKANSTLYSTLIRDGIMFYAALQVLSLCSLSVLATAPPELSTILTLTHRVLHGMLSARLLLNLRSAVSPASAADSLPWKAAAPPLSANRKQNTFEMKSWSASATEGSHPDQVSWFESDRQGTAVAL